jgi:hypothetical protein
MTWLAGCAALGAVPAVLAQVEDPVIAGKAVVRVNPGYSIGAAIAELSAAAAPAVFTVGDPGLSMRRLYLVEFSPPCDEPLDLCLIKQVLEQPSPAREWGELLYAGHDPEGRTGSVWFYVDGTGESFYSGQFAGPGLGLPAAQQVSTGAGTVVAVLDTGIDATHPALAGAIKAGGFNFIDGSGNTGDPVNGHGTFVAGLIRFVAPDAALLPVVVLDAQGAGNAWGLACGLFYAIDQGVDVINMSLGSTYESNAVQVALDEAGSRGIAVVAAGGNQGVEEPEEFPAAEDGAIGVATVDHLGVKAPFSNYNEKFFISAPGTTLAPPGGLDPAHTVFSTLPGGQYGYYDAGGTSLSTAFVSGAVALLRAQQPGLPADASGLDRIRCMMERSAASIDAQNQAYEGMLGVGGLDVGRAVQMSAGDVDADGTIGIEDFLSLLKSWGECSGPPAWCAADLDCNGTVGIADFLRLLQNWD